MHAAGRSLLNIIFPDIPLSSYKKKKIEERTAGINYNACILWTAHGLEHYIGRSDFILSYTGCSGALRGGHYENKSPKTDQSDCYSNTSYASH